MYTKLRTDNNHIEKCKLGKLTLWYIKLCLLKKVFPNDLMTQRQWEYILPEIVMWILVKDNLLLLLDIDPLKTL